MKPKASGKKEIIKIMVEISEIENITSNLRKSTKLSLVLCKDAQNWQISHWTGVVEKTQITEIRNEKGNTTTNLTEIKRMIKDPYEQLYASKFDNWAEMTNSGKDAKWRSWVNKK